MTADSASAWRRLIASSTCANRRRERPALTRPALRVRDGAGEGSRISFTAITRPVAFLFLLGGATGSCASAADDAAATSKAARVAPSVVASRNSGVAPLAVFFDATGTTAEGVTNHPFHELEYMWNFGDAAGGATWRHGSRAGASSRNVATGPVTAHVFEAAGTYRVCVKITGAAGAVEPPCVSVTVLDAETQYAGRTYCIASTMPVAGADGCPVGATPLASSDFATVISEQSRAGAVRLLFRRGDVFSSSRAAEITGTGPGIVGAYGSGPKPVFRGPAKGTSLGFSSPATPDFSDWRIVDLDFDGQGSPDAVGIQPRGGARQVTLLRVDIRNTGSGFNITTGVLDALNANARAVRVPVWDQLAVVDSTVREIVGPGGYGIFMSATRSAVLGSQIDDTSASVRGHGMRVPYANKLVIANNTFSTVNAASSALTVRAPVWSGTATIPPQTLTENIVVSDNRFAPGSAALPVTFRATSNSVDERLRNVLFERNWVLSGSTSIAVDNQASLATFRNNIVDASGGPGLGSIRVLQAGAAPPPNRVWIFNNTLFTTGTDGSTLVAVDVYKAATNVVVRNQLAYAPRRAGVLRTVRDDGSEGFIQTNNTPDGAIGRIRPWASAMPASPADFRPASSYATGGGASVPVWSDFFLDPIRGGRGIGAVAPRGK